MKKWDKRSVRILSRHPSHSSIRNAIKTPTGKRVVLRLGSNTPTANYDLEINTVASIENTANKMKMKQLFYDAGVRSPKFYSDIFNAVVDKFPILAKKTYRSRGAGMVKINNQEELTSFLSNLNMTRHNNNPYYFEQFHNYSKEYRIHVSELGGYFYTCRKMLRQEYAGTDSNWYRNNSNCIWILEENELFDKPSTWDDIVADCQRAREALGLSIGGFDVKVTQKGNWMILEGNSACSFGDITKEVYETELTNIVNKYFN